LNEIINYINVTPCFEIKKWTVLSDKNVNVNVTRCFEIKQCVLNGAGINVYVNVT
jgi:hypothetical protein